MNRAASSDPRTLRIAGITALSTVDWPGQLVATVFCQGCPWRCGYCHNTSILDPKTAGVLPWDQVLSFMNSRRGLLDGMVFSGGEATMQHAVYGAAAAVKQMGFAVGLHTGGAYPARLADLVGCGREDMPVVVDWVGFDLKASPSGYTSTVGRPGAWQRVRESLGYLVTSGIDYEARMTVTPALTGQVHDVLRCAADAGVHQLVLQQARSDGAPAEFAAQLASYARWNAAFEETVNAAKEVGSELGVRIECRAA
ncbi:anaerobic ribonucleoside-triphosphate reductase activating protein [Devriesea agamarum]|uniref:anaerobic ribonucleoside-triphosphate reductase activating protein n=1 Tax=Devriesea agamarum TaxID=472569 RepID=UPI00071D5794|nr:anaerobic ribonucleoside-triphosphate reductase activating protein [Devriesea agamarum]